MIIQPAIIRETRTTASDIEGSTAIHYGNIFSALINTMTSCNETNLRSILLDPCVYPVPIWNGNTTDFSQFSTLNTKASGDGQLTWIFAGFYTCKQPVIQFTVRIQNDNRC